LNLAELAAVSTRGEPIVSPARTARLVAAGICLAAALPGCGGGGGKKTVTPTGAPTTVKETEYALAPGTIKVSRAGTLKVVAKNAGKMEHALEIEGKGVEKRTPNIKPGKTATLTASLKPGSYQMYCPIDGHKQLGMKGTVSVAR
jgi:uncharacterized cupredoxin-like copper-binding protein